MQVRACPAGGASVQRCCAARTQAVGITCQASSSRPILKSPYRKAPRANAQNLAEEVGLLSDGHSPGSPLGRYRSALLATYFGYSTMVATQPTSSVARAFNSCLEICPLAYSSAASTAARLTGSVWNRKMRRQQAQAKSFNFRGFAPPR